MPWVEPVSIQLNSAADHPDSQPGPATVHLVPLELSHAGALWEAIGGTPESSREVLRYQPTKPPESVEEMRNLISLRLGMQAKGDAICFAIVLLGKQPPSTPPTSPTKQVEGNGGIGTPIGVTCYLEIQPANRSLEIGSTWIGPRWQRTRVNTECKYLLLRHAFEVLSPGAVRVFLRGDDRNRKSFNAVMRLGAVHEGTFRKSRIVWDGFCRDTWYASILREEWLGEAPPNAGIRRRLESKLTEGEPL